MKQELKTTDDAFLTSCTRPLFKGDKDAYAVRIKTESDSERVQVTAIRSDGVTISGTGTERDENGYSEYVLSRDMHSIPGRLILRVSVISGGSALTLRQIECDVLEG